jgi:hypothetical protein
MIYYALSCDERVDNNYEPTTYFEAISYIDHEKWIAAMQDEMQSLEKNCTWDVIPLPKGKKLFAASGSTRETRVYLLASLQSIR